MKVIIDRFEGDFAVVTLGDGTTANLPRILVPEAAEGDTVRIELDAADRSERAGRIKKLMDDVWE